MSWRTLPAPIAGSKHLSDQVTQRRFADFSAGVSRLVAKAPRRRKPARVLSPAERHERALGRAFRCGEGYCRRDWVRRPPPRFRAAGAHDEPGLQLTRAFFRGYTAMRRTMARRRWRDPVDWSQLGSAVGSNRSGVAS